MIIHRAQFARRGNHMLALGRRVFGLGALLLGAACLYWHSFAAVWEPIPDHLDNKDLWILINGGVLVAGGLAINLPRKLAVWGALFLVLVFAFWVLVLDVGVRMIGNLGNWGVWQSVAEIAAMWMGAIISYTLVSDGHEERLHRIAHAARIVFGVCCIIFGISHFLYAKMTAGMTPHWLPPGPIFWTYLTGVGHILAGVALITGLQARLAAILLTLMFAIFSALVHIPALIHEPTSAMNWIINGINLLLVGAAWAVADSLKKAGH